MTTPDVYRTISTPQQIIKRALRLLGVLAADTPLQGEMLPDGLESFNDMLDAWNIEKLMIPALSRQTFALVVGQGQYQIGAGGGQDFDAERPVHLEQGQVFLTGGTLGLLEVELDAMPLEEYGRILNKNIDSIPGRFFYNPGVQYGTIYLDPLPSSPFTLILWLESLFAQIAMAAINTAVIIPPAYKNALVYNLAIEMAPEYEVTPSDIVASRATKYKADIKRLNQRDLTIQGDPAVAGEIRRGTGWVDSRAFAGGGF